MQRVEQQPQGDKIFAPFANDEPLQQAVMKLRAAGKVVVKALDDGQTAKATGCNQQLVLSGSEWTTVAVSES